MNRRLEEEIRRAVIEEKLPPHRTVYIPGEDPEDFGRRAARDLWNRHINDAGNATAQLKQG